MPVRQVHVRDHRRRKPLQEGRIHVDDYSREQDINPRPQRFLEAFVGPSSWNPEDPRRKETDKIQADARAQGQITDRQAIRIEELADDLILDYNSEKLWNGKDHTSREHWLGPVAGVDDRSWAHESWADLPGEVKVRLMRTYYQTEGTR